MSCSFVVQQQQASIWMTSYDVMNETGGINLGNKYTFVRAPGHEIAPRVPIANPIRSNERASPGPNEPSLTLKYSDQLTTLLSNLRTNRLSRRTKPKTTFFGIGMSMRRASLKILLQVSSVVATINLPVFLFEQYMLAIASATGL